MNSLTQKLYSKFYQSPSEFLKNSNPLINHVGKRLLHVGFIPSSAIANFLDGIVGMKDAAIFIFGGASDINGWQAAQTRFGCLETCLSSVFRHSISALNIHAKFYQKMSAAQYRFCAMLQTKVEEPSISMEGHGILTNCLVHGILRDYARSFTDNGNVIAAKFTFFIMAPAAVLTRITDLAIGIVATVGAICTLGTQPSVNHLAFRGLQITGIFNDLFYCTAKLVNSQAGRAPR